MTYLDYLIPIFFITSYSLVVVGINSFILNKSFNSTGISIIAFDIFSTISLLTLG